MDLSLFLLPLERGQHAAINVRQGTLASSSTRISPFSPRALKSAGPVFTTRGLCVASGNMLALVVHSPWLQPLLGAGCGTAALFCGFLHKGIRWLQWVQSSFVRVVSRKLLMTPSIPFLKSLQWLPSFQNSVKSRAFRCYLTTFSPQSFSLHLSLLSVGASKPIYLTLLFHHTFDAFWIPPYWEWTTAEQIPLYVSHWASRCQN